MQKTDVVGERDRERIGYGGWTMEGGREVECVTVDSACKREREHL